MNPTDQQQIDNFYNGYLREIFEFKMWKRTLEALEEINRASREYLDSDFSGLIEMSPENLRNHLKKEGSPDAARLLICSHLFKEEADIHAIQGNPHESEPLYEEAFHLFLEVHQTDPELDLKKHMIVFYELENKVPPNKISSETVELIDRLYEKFSE